MIQEELALGVNELVIDEFHVHVWTSWRPENNEVVLDLSSKHVKAFSLDSRSKR